ncbi:MAG TPA: hypothetical protein VH083_27390 [Myxococcales bacterium]|nr:hypothetical protein [Myxococcales bacterium]
MMRCRLIATLPLLCSLLACGTNDNSQTGGTVPDSGSPDSGAPDSGTLDGGTASCSPATTFDGGTAALVAGTVTANLVDETGAAMAAGQPVFITGLDISSQPEETNASGAASVSFSRSEKIPAFKYGDAVDYAEFGIPLTAANTDFTKIGTGKLGTAKLSGKAGAPLTPGSNAVSGDVTVSVPAGAAVGINPLIYETADQQMFRAASIPLTNLGPVLANAPADVALVFGLAPAETTICPPAKVTVAVPASLAWPAGSAVEFWIQSLDVGQTWAPYAGWAKISDGTVSADGKTASTTGGFPVLENFAVRRVVPE